MPQLTIRKKDLGDNTILLEPVGCLDAHTFEKMEQAIRSLFKEKIYRIVVSLPGLDYISSAGAGVFIGNITPAQEKGGNIVLVNPSPNVKEVFDLLGLSQIFPMAESVDDALTYFNEGG
ncbi:MAG: STAS domain-containing protein [Planctomycetota bacterium]|jgi:anti-sigma B factor antagonist